MARACLAARRATNCARSLSTTPRHGEHRHEGLPVHLEDIQAPIFNVGAVQDHVASGRSVGRSVGCRRRQPAGSHAVELPAAALAGGRPAADLRRMLAETTAVDGSCWTSCSPRTPFVAPRGRAACPPLGRVPARTVRARSFLALLGAVAARTGGASVLIGAGRVMFWGTHAMAITAGEGALFDTAV